MNREEIIGVIVDIYKDYEIKNLGFDLIKLLKKMEINLVPYSNFINSYGFVKFDEDGFNIINPTNNKVEIYYNEKISPKERIKFTIPHEIGHICLGHILNSEKETEQQRWEANQFAMEFYCPQSLLIHYNINSISQIMKTFCVTEKYAIVILDKLNKRTNKKLSFNEKKLVEVFECNKKYK